VRGIRGIRGNVLRGWNGSLEESGHDGKKPLNVDSHQPR